MTAGISTSYHCHWLLIALSLSLSLSEMVTARRLHIAHFTTSLWQQSKDTDQPPGTASHTRVRAVDDDL